jgi:lysophospholipase L1-like esterase
MLNTSQSRLSDAFGRSAILTGISIVGLMALQAAAPKIYTLPGGRYPAMMIELTASRAILFNPGVNGYYEHIFNAEGRDVDQRRSKWLSAVRVYDSFRIYRPKLNTKNLSEWEGPAIPTNNFGYVDRTWSLQKPHGTWRVALLGDSVTEGFGLNPPSQRFGNLLENQVNAVSADGSRRFEVMNFSVAGYRLSQILDVAEEDAPRFQPDTYVLALTELSVFRGWDTHLVDLVALDSDLKYGILRQIAARAHTSPADDDNTLHAKLAPFRMTALQEILLLMKSNAERHHAQFVVLLVPSLEDADLIHRRFEDIPPLLQSLGITTVSLLDTFDGISDVLPLLNGREDVHPNALGHAMIARNLYAKLRMQPKACAALAGDNADVCKQ